MVWPILASVAGCAPPTAPTMAPSAIGATGAIAIYGSCAQKPVYPRRRCGKTGKERPN